MSTASIKRQSRSLAMLHDQLRGKGDYLHQRGNDWWLATELGHKPVQVVTFKPADETWEVPGDSEAAYVFVFDLKRADLTVAVGGRVANFLAHCQTRGLDYTVARPLPPEILPPGSTPSDLGIPRGCDQCLDLFRLDSSGDTLLCDGGRHEGFRFTRSGRPQVHSYLRLQFGDAPTKLANGKSSSLQLLCNLACTERLEGAEPTDHCFSFPAYWVSKVGWKRSRVLRHFIEEFGGRISNGLVLDDGGGHGKDAYFLKENGFEPVLVDINTELLRFAKHRRDETGLKFPIVCSDGRSLPFEDAKFSGVFSGGVMHHAMTREGVQQYLSEASRVLRPNGLFFGDVWACWDGTVPNGLYFIESKEILERMLNSAGFRLVKPIDTRQTRFERHKHMWCFVGERVGTL